MYTSQPVIVAGAEQFACKGNVVLTTALSEGVIRVTDGPLTTVIVSVAAVLAPDWPTATIGAAPAAP